MSNAITNTQLAIIDFWSQFGMPVYEQGQANVMVSGSLQSAPFPYITYSFSTGRYGDGDILTAQVWTRSTGNSQLFSIIEQIAAAIPNDGGINLPVGDKKGVISLWRSNPFIQPYPQDDPMFRVRLISVQIRNYVL